MSKSYYNARYVRGRGWVATELSERHNGLERDAENLALCVVRSWGVMYLFFVDNLCLPGRARYVSRIARSVPDPPPGMQKPASKPHAWLRSSTTISRDFAESVVHFMPILGLDNRFALCERFYGMGCTGGPQDFLCDACELYPEYWTPFEFDGSEPRPAIPVCEYHLREWQAEYEGMSWYSFYPIDSHHLLTAEDLAAQRAVRE